MPLTSLSAPSRYFAVIALSDGFKSTVDWMGDEFIRHFNLAHQERIRESYGREAAEILNDLGGLGGAW